MPPRMAPECAGLRTPDCVRRIARGAREDAAVARRRHDALRVGGNVEADALVGVGGARQPRQFRSRPPHVPDDDVVVAPRRRQQQEAVVREARLRDAAAVAAEQRHQPRRVLRIEPGGARERSGGVEPGAVGREAEARDDPALAVAALLRRARRARLAAAPRPRDVEDAYRPLEARVDPAARRLEGGAVRRGDLVEVVVRGVARAQRAGVRVPQVERVVAARRQEAAARRLRRVHERVPRVVVDAVALAHAHDAAQLRGGGGGRGGVGQLEEPQLAVLARRQQAQPVGRPLDALHAVVRQRRVAEFVPAAADRLSRAAGSPRRRAASGDKCVVVGGGG